MVPVARRRSARLAAMHASATGAPQVARRRRRNSRTRLQSLPPELLTHILSLVDHRDDRHSIGLSNPHLRYLSRRTPHALTMGYYHCECWEGPMAKLAEYFPLITDFTVEIWSESEEGEVLDGIGAACPQLERLSLENKLGGISFAHEHWIKLAVECSLLKTLELHDPTAPDVEPVPVPPLHVFPHLSSLTLCLPTTQLEPLFRCSFLTSLTLLNPKASTLDHLPILNTNNNRHTPNSLSAPGSQSATDTDSSVLESKLLSLTLHGADLRGHLTFLTAFTSLTSLSLHTCSIEPAELITLSRSLTTLTHLTLHDCPSLSSRSLAPLLTANPALSSLSLHTISGLLSTEQGFHFLLHRATCNSLNTLTLSGGSEKIHRMIPQAVSLETLVSMLVQTVARGGGGEGGVGGSRGSRATVPACGSLVDLTLSGLRFILTVPLGCVEVPVAFGQLKRLALVECSGLEEEQLMQLLIACAALQELRVEGCESMSDAVLGGLRMAAVTRVALVSCHGITSDGLVRVQVSFPRLRHLEVECCKMLARTRRYLLGRGVTLLSLQRDVKRDVRLLPEWGLEHGEEGVWDEEDDM